MKVTFTTREYTRLLELVWLGLQTTIPRDGQEASATTRFAGIEQKLLELATPFGCADLVTVGSDGRLTLSEKLYEDERLRKILGDYDNDTFWHELVTRLADRDLSAEQARHHASGKGGPPINADARLKQLEDGYWDEFEKNDLANVVLLKGAKG
ncbi:MAG: hypothetical protein LBK99_23035 [Opitutaceae bacterium]|jgi:hypothetical protein|nr:hypothetical protein [Opitutaceae bacterium]